MSNKPSPIPTRSEERIVRPFLTYKEFFDDCGIRFDTNESFANNIHIKPNAQVPITPEIHFKFDLNTLEEMTGCNRLDLGIVVTLEDRFFKHNRAVFSFPVSQCEGKIVPLDFELEDLAWPTETSIGLYLVMTKAKERLNGVAHRPGQCLAQKLFRIPNDSHFGSDLPFRFVEPSVFEQLNLPKNTSYFIKVLDEDFNSISDFKSGLEILFNQNLQETLKKMERADDVIFFNMVMCEICFLVLSIGIQNLNDGEPIREGSLLHGTVQKLTNLSGSSESEILVKARRNAGCELLAMVQSATKLNESILRKK